MREGEALARHRHWQVAANRSEWHRQERSRCQSSSASSLGSDPLNKRRSVPRLIGVNEGQANDKQSRSSVVTSMTSLLETPRVSILPAPPAYPPIRSTESSLYLDLFHLNLESAYFRFRLGSLEAIFVVDRSEWRRWRTGCEADRGPRSCFARRSLFTSLRVPSPFVDFMLDRSRLRHHPLFQTFRSARGSFRIRHGRGQTNLHR